MNTVELKAAELLAIAARYGFEGKVTKFGDSFIKISYVSGNLHSRIQLTGLGNASVKTYERKDKIANLEFESKLAMYQQIANRRAGASA